MDIGTDKIRSVFDRTVHMTLCGEIQHSVALFRQSIHELLIAYIAFYKFIAPVFFYILKIILASAIGKLVQIYDFITAILPQNIPHKIRTYKTAPASD